MAADNRAYVGHGPIADFHCIPVDDFAEGGVGKVFGNQGNEFFTNVSFNTFTERGVEVDNFTASSFLFVCRGGGGWAVVQFCCIACCF